MSQTRNPYFTAVEVNTMNEADYYFDRLLREERRDGKWYDDACESVVASLCYVAGYYGEETRRRVAQLYSWRSPYRGTPTQ